MTLKQAFAPSLQVYPRNREMGAAFDAAFFARKAALKDYQENNTTEALSAFLAASEKLAAII